MLQPIDPGGNARESTLAAYRAGKSKWERDPLQYACKAYCTARQGRTLFSDDYGTDVMFMGLMCYFKTGVSRASFSNMDKYNTHLLGTLFHAGYSVQSGPSGCEKGFVKCFQNVPLSCLSSTTAAVDPNGLRNSQRTFY